MKKKELYKDDLQHLFENDLKQAHILCRKRKC
jgi:hypothetical protein